MKLVDHAVASAYISACAGSDAERVAVSAFAAIASAGRFSAWMQPCLELRPAPAAALEHIIMVRREHQHGIAPSAPAAGG